MNTKTQETNGTLPLKTPQNVKNDVETIETAETTQVPPKAPESPQVVPRQPTATISTEVADELAMAQYETATRAMLPTEKMLAVMGKFAQHCVETGQMPSTINTAAKVVVVFQAGRELGIPPIKSLYSFYFVNNKMTMYGPTVIERIRMWAKIEYGECTAESATVTITRKDDKTSLSSTITMKELQDRGLAGKDTFKKHPKTMLIYKAVGEIVRHIVPEAVGAMAVEGDWSPGAENDIEQTGRKGKLAEPKPNETGEYELPSVNVITRKYNLDTLRNRCSQLGIEGAETWSKTKCAQEIRSKLIEQNGSEVIATD